MNLNGECTNAKGLTKGWQPPLQRKHSEGTETESNLLCLENKGMQTAREGKV